jgi:hypothetical protein
MASGRVGAAGVDPAQKATVTRLLVDKPVIAAMPLAWSLDWRPANRRGRHGRMLV